VADIVVARYRGSARLPLVLELAGTVPWTLENPTGSESRTFAELPFTVDWVDRSGNLLLTLGARPAERRLVLNSCVDGSWGEEVVVPDYPFALERPFTLRFDLLADRYRIYVDERRVSDFAHRAPPAVSFVRASLFLWRLTARDQSLSDAGGGTLVAPVIKPGSLAVSGGWRHEWAAPEGNPAVARPLDPLRLFAVIGSWNEEDVIQATVANCARQGCERVYLVDNASDDRTADRAQDMGAILARTYKSERYDEAERIAQMQSVVEEVSAAEGAEHIWWLFADADEFHHGPGGMTLRDYLATLDRRFRIVGARHFNHFPTGSPAYIEGRHPLDFQPLCYEIPEVHCELGHYKHPLQRWDREGPPITAALGAHFASCAEQLLEPTVATFYHHFPFREEQTTRARLARLFGVGEGRLDRIGEDDPCHGHLRMRRRSLDAVYGQRWHEVAFYPACPLGYAPELKPWAEWVEPIDREVPRWYPSGTSDSARVTATAPGRPELQGAAAVSGEPGYILLYHRIAEPVNDAYGIVTSPTNFADHLELLSDLGDLVPLAELPASVARAPTSPRFAVTFDDGYGDNLHVAKPLLDRFDAPATLFVATDFVGRRSFWWDELSELILASAPLPTALEVELEGIAHRWELHDSRRAEVMYAIWHVLLPLAPGDRLEALAAIRSQFAMPASVAPDARPLTRAELAQLVDDGLVDVGAHTRSHPLLTTLRAEAMQAEIAGGKAWIEDFLDRRVTLFSYPFGVPEDPDEHVLAMLRSAGFDMACLCAEGPVTTRSSMLRLPRLYVLNWTADELERKLSDLHENLVR
jgi:peptidoglycan/xylan/chitin deacetylase (PgdA/CDA1 family)/glycosyltransferase involved in cell wall biosynthesis